MPKSVALFVAVGVIAASGGACAPISESTQLKVQPLEAPRTQVVKTGEGFMLRGKRVADEVVVQVAATDYCTRRKEQRARGFKVVTRKAKGVGLVMEWIAGGVFSAVGGLVFAYAEAPPDYSLEVDKSTSQRVYGSGLMMAGTALLVGAIYQTSILGVEKTDIGVKTLKHDGLIKPCKLRRAATGKVRLTLDDGLQLTADVQPDGVARVKLPADLDARLLKGGKRATIEVLGDWRSQRRIDLSQDGNQTL